MEQATVTLVGGPRDGEIVARANNGNVLVHVHYDKNAACYHFGAYEEDGSGNAVWTGYKRTIYEERLN